METVVLLSQLKQKPDDYINVTIELDDMDITSAETKATYDEIKKYVAEHNAGMKVSNLYISQVKRKCGIEVGKNLRVATRRMDYLQGNSTTAATDLELVPSPNLPKNEDSRQPQCPEDKERAIVEPLSKKPPLQNQRFKWWEHVTKEVEELYEFLHIFKSDLKNIEIDRKENKDFWLCDLIMFYDDYKVHAEFESTGIKKLIRLFTYLQKMVRGEIVFIDEFDSNLHDVYLCAILEYLMEHGKGQLCFTTHNVGPMDVLRRRKKSIDFLSENHKIYPWTANGNYSPAKLYRNGMIEGSPFNVDSIDFIGVFDSDEEDE